MEKVNLAEKFGLFEEYWSPKIVGELNGQQVKVAKALGEFDWHRHESEDELFLVVKGEMRIELRDGAVQLREGEFFIVLRGVEHRPVAEVETHVLLFEPASTLNTGNVRTGKRTTQRPRQRIHRRAHVHHRTPKPRLRIGLCPAAGGRIGVME